MEIHSKTKSIIYIALFVALIFVSGLIKINMLSIPFTLQTFAVMFTACILGYKKGLYAVLVYILMGLVGIPVFTKGGGFFYVLEPSFGYILSFIPAVIFVGILKNKTKRLTTLSCILFCSGLIMLLIGGLYAYILLSSTTGVSDVTKFISGYFLAFIPAELLKSIVCAIIYHRMKKMNINIE